MKIGITFLFCFVCYTSAFSQTTFQSLATLPPFPQAGKEMAFIYNPKGMQLENVQMIDGIVYFTDGKEIHVEDVILTKDQDIYKGKISIPRNAKAVLLSFESASLGRANELSKECFPVKLFDKRQQVIEEGYAALAELYNRWHRLNERGKNNELVVGWLEEEFKKHPQNKKKYLDTYLGALREIGIEKNKALIIKELVAFEQSKNLTEDHLILLHSWYEILNETQKKTQYASLMRLQYPKGKYVTNERYFQFIQEADNQKKRKYYEDFKKEFPSSENIKSMQLNLAYHATKEGNWQEFEAITNSLKMQDKASLYNSIALESAEATDLEKTILEKASMLAAQLVRYAKTELTNEKKTTYLSGKQWKAQIKNVYATYADTYGFVLLKQSNYDAALPYLREASEIFATNTEVNEHYAYALVKSSTPLSDIKSRLEQFVKEGTASTKIKEMLKSIYERAQGNDARFESYISDLEKDLREKIKTKLRKKRISEPIPHLNWVNMEGKKVNLSDFKGKIIVLNFWATWCEHCLASFPILQQLIGNYSHQEVAFLFVNTWENAENRKQTILDFLGSQQYAFQVLVDADDSVIDAFGVNNIFSKIIIDKEGKVRFKSTEIHTDSDALTKELTLMIEMVQEQ